MVFAGIDIGTSGTKMSVFDHGQLLFKLQKSYPSIRKETQHTIDAQAVLDTVMMLLEEAIKRTPTIEAVGVTSFGECFVLLDYQDKVLFESMLYTDPRGEIEAREIADKIGVEKLGEITGQKAHPMFSLPKILFIKKHFPEVFHQAKRICLMEDFIVYSLTGHAYIDYSLAARTLCFDIHTNHWSDIILNAFDIDKALFSTPVPIGHHAGYVKKSLAVRWKATSPISIINVSHDQIASVIGAIEKEEDGIAVAGMGTCECITPIFNKLKRIHTFYDGGYGIVPLYKPNLYGAYSLINTGSALIDWVIQSFFSDSTHNALPIFDAIHEKLDFIPKHIMVMPHFAGSATPYMDAEAKGAIVNLDLGSTRYDIYQATLESLCYEAKYSLSILEKSGIKITKIYATGGGALNKAWLQIKANILDVPIYVLENNDSGTVGTAMVVGCSIGCFSSMSEAREAFVRVKTIIHPDHTYKSQYDQQYDKYIHLYKALLKVR